VSAAEQPVRPAGPQQAPPGTPPAGPADSGLLSPGWADTGIDAELSDTAWVQAMLDVEVALAGAQAETGVVPGWAADAVAAAARADRLDLPGLVAGVHSTANPVVVLVNQLTRAVREDNPAAADHVHRGSTSQDILDSAAMLVCARVLRRVRGDLLRSAGALARLAGEHAATPMVGRTLTQHAVPVTFGLRAAGWLQLVLDAVERVERLLADGLPASLGGAAGTLAAYGEYAAMAGAASRAEGGMDLVAPFAARLGLAEPLFPWHQVRTPVADVASAVTFVTAALGKIAVDVQVLTRTEIGEVSEPAEPQRGASSAMPQKHNPVLATAVATAARQVPVYALVLHQSVIAEDERSAGAWHAEWQPLRECLRLCAGAAVNAAELTGGLVVHPRRMLENLAMTGGAVVSERLSAALAPVLGKAAAKKTLTAATEEAERTGADLADVLDRLLQDCQDRPDHAALKELADPLRYTGSASALVERVLDRYRRRAD
jgi:3-carboxy-cis,cis-muconate cycloisomerase